MGGIHIQHGCEDGKPTMNALGQPDRRHRSIKLLVAVVCLIVVSPARVGAATPPLFVLQSPDFAAGRQMREEFVLNSDGCIGQNVSPALQWSGAPAGTKSFVITLFDEDERGTPSGWWHWIVYDIPATRTELARGAGTSTVGHLPEGARQGRSDDGTESYSGPCPEIGEPAHRYLFTIYALNIERLPVPAGSSGAMVTWTLREHALAKATLVARHRHIASARDDRRSGERH